MDLGVGWTRYRRSFGSLRFAQDDSLDLGEMGGTCNRRSFDSLRFAQDHKSMGEFYSGHTNVRWLGR
jgi:hypothetical protein